MLPTDRFALWIALSLAALVVLWFLKRMWNALGQVYNRTWGALGGWQWAAVIVVVALFVIIANPNLLTSPK